MNDRTDRIAVALKRLKNAVVRETFPVGDMLSKETGYKSGSALPVPDATWKKFRQGDTFGGFDRHMWLDGEVTLPDSAAEGELFLRLSLSCAGSDALNPQFMIYIDGALVQGFDTNHLETPLDSGKKKFRLTVYVYSGSPTPDPDTGERPVLDFSMRFEVIRKDLLAEKVYYDLKVPYEVLAYSEENTKEYCDVLRALQGAAKLLDLRDIRSGFFRESLQKASEYMDAFYAEVCAQGKPSVTCIGHTHIDIAWLWTLAQTREKAQRSFSTVIELMREYPEYKFMSSQAILYDIVKEEAPALYENIKKAVKAGRWEVEGSMWVEADCNLISGESLVRQILVGKNFFKREFGIDTKTVWQPDVFGYSAAMPQILRKSGVEWFVTSKISWNDTNKMPYDMFLWKGIDGTEVKTYFLTAQDMVKGQPPANFTTYVGMGSPSQVAGSWNRFQQKELCDESILTYGYGDGGGGPTPGFIEQIKRMAHGIPGCPTAEFGFAADFLRRIFSQAQERGGLPVWAGELYLEFHRGTYTSQAANKRNNRKNEYAYLGIEALSVFGREILGTKYPKERLDEAWKIILTNQFHDVIPGSSIGEVYRDCAKDYARLAETARELSAPVLNSVLARVKGKKGLLVVNPNSFEGEGEVEFGGRLYSVSGIPAKGYRVVPLPENKESRVRVDLAARVLENDCYRVEFDEKFRIASLYSKTFGRELLKEGEKGNALLVFEDDPLEYDAWELRPDYKEKCWEIDSVESAEAVDLGAAKGLRIRRKFLGSEIEQTILLYERTRRLDFVTSADWNTEHVVLKAAFPLDINAEKASFDIQFGTIERNTHDNTSWDAAKFEVCAHKYADLSENGFGVALMNDCKYGYDVRHGTMRLTLLRCPTFPDPNCDKTRHTFTYSIYAHGDAGAPDTVQAAFSLNNPMRAFAFAGNAKGDLPEAYSLVSCDNGGVIVETVKQAEQSDAIVVRMYEALNRRTKARIRFGFNVCGASVTDLMENPAEELEVKDNAVEISLRPFEIVTLLLKTRGE